jgi:hypothetical protein
MSTNKTRILNIVFRGKNSLFWLFEKVSKYPGVLKITHSQMKVEFEDRIETFVHASDWENLLALRPDETKIWIDQGLTRGKTSVVPIV